MALGTLEWSGTPEGTDPVGSAYDEPLGPGAVGTPDSIGTPEGTGTPGPASGEPMGPASLTSRIG
jgi:hypothetical protein